MAAKPKVVHYVDNTRFLETLIEYKKVKQQALDDSLQDQPQIPEYIGECLLQIARRLSNKANFSGYTFKEDMISDAVENCILYMHNFDPEKSKNPFAYFTQIIHFAFIRRIEREKKQVYTKYKYAIHKTLLGEDHSISNGSDDDLKNPSWMSYDNVHEFIKDYETKISKSKKKKAILLEDDDTDSDSLDALDLPSDILDPIDNLDELDEDFSEPTEDAEDLGFTELPESLILNGAV